MEEKHFLCDTEGLVWPSTGDAPEGEPTLLTADSLETVRNKAGSINSAPRPGTTSVCVKSLWSSRFSRGPGAKDAHSGYSALNGGAWLLLLSAADRCHHRSIRLARRCIQGV